MKTDIVKVMKNEAFTDSKVIAEMLEVGHTDLLRTIRRIKERQDLTPPSSGVKYPQKFIESDYVNKRGRKYPMYVLNEQAFMKLAMHLKGYEKAEMVQDNIIEAFSLMKDALLNHQNASWLSARKNGKAIRSEETHVIKEFVEYAKSQGSKSAEKYYMAITKMTNKSLEFLVKSDHGGSVRDMASIQELGFIQVVDNRASEAIQQGMKDQLPYKYIYKYAKEQVNSLAEMLDFKKQISNSN